MKFTEILEELKKGEKVTREDCQKAIDTIGEDNLKKYYFDIAEVEEDK